MKERSSRGLCENVFVQELEMKEAADSTLSEVRRKISETNGCLKLIGRLRKLRQLRRDQAERKGSSVHILSGQVPHTVVSIYYAMCGLCFLLFISCHLELCSTVCQRTLHPSLHTRTA